jgi:tetratricopeptide (TPR) repeat protein
MGDFASAVSLHQSGRVREAERAYRALLAATPDQPDVLHALGVLRHQSGDSEAAADLLARAAALTPGRAEYHFNLGLALFRLNRLAEAAQHFQAAIRLRPDWAAAHFDLGNALRALGQPDEAARAYRQALRLKPDYLEAQVNLGNALKDAGRTEQAANAYRRALRLRPGEASIHHNLGAVLLDQGNAAEAETCFRQALRLTPDFSPSLQALSTLLQTQASHAAAVPVLQSLLRLHPNDAALHERLGDSLRAAGQFPPAIDAYRKATALQPDRLSARFGLAETFRLARDFPAAKAELEALVTLCPDAWQAHHDVGNVLRDLGDFGAAEAAYRTALALAETPGTLNHLGAVLRDQGRLDEAIAVLQRALLLDPALQDATYNLAITHLSAGRLKEGFAGYDSRFAKFNAPARAGRAWAGENPRGKTILVHAEQGLGDTIQFARYLPLLAAKGARIIFQVQPTLARLFHGLAGADAILPLDQPAPRHDSHVPLMSLPKLLPSADPLPIPIPYLAADPANTAAWQARLAPLPGLKIGLAWAGNPGFQADHLRSVPPAALSPLASLNASFISLQKNPAGTPDLPLHDFTNDLGDMADTATLIAALDLVISVDTAVAHLAGALGRPIFLLNRFGPCWRWQFETETSLWYPSLRQFRQAAPGHWTSPIMDICNILRTMGA